MRHVFRVKNLASAAVALALMFSQASLKAQERAAEVESGWAQTAWENFKSPITTDAKNYLVIGGALTAVIFALEDQVVDPFQKEVSGKKPLGSTSKIGDIGGRGVPNALYIAGMLGYGLIDSNDQAKRNSMGMLQATLYSTLVTSALKHSVRETRPDTSSRDSFPSGHTTAAFAFASYVGCRHSLGWGIAAYSLASFVGFSRINDNRHFLHDVTAGATIGTAYGLGVCFSENSRENKELRTSLSWYAAPTDEGGMAGLTFSY